jgi:hypothetical protein
MKKLISILTIVGMLSGCGVVKNLEKPGLPEIAKPKFGGDTYVPAEGQFWAKWGDDICAVSLITVVAGVGLLVMYDCVYGSNLLSRELYRRKE